MRVNEPVTDHEIGLDDDDVIVSRTDAGGRIAFINKAFIDICGFTEDELIGAPHNLIRHPDMPKEAFADLWRTIKAGRPWEGLVKNRTKTGDFYWVRANVTPVIENGAIRGYISIRTKPSRGQVAATEQAYQAIRAGVGGLRIEDGAAVRPGLGNWWRQQRVSIGGRLVAMVAVATATAGGAVGLEMGLGASAAAIGCVGVGVALVGGLAWSLAGLLRQLLARIEQHLEAMGRNDIAYEIEMPETPEFRHVTSLMRATKAKLAYAVYEQRETARRVDQVRQQVLDEMARTVERESGQTIADVSQMTAANTADATEMARSAERVSEHAQSVAAAAEESLVNAQAVSAASEQLACSIAEISQRVTHSSTIARAAAEGTRDSERAIGDLSTEVAGIAEMSNLIDAIAKQTNLLALNATIEAARAGDAGRGFAVVAAEVKNLADHTSRSTQEIGRRLAAVHDATARAVQAVLGVGRTVEEIDAATTAVAEAMQQQSIATQEISRNVAETSVAAREVSTLIARVSDDARQTGVQADTIRAKSGQLADKVGALRQFLVQVVRTSTLEADRASC